jgi:hypothetical protein
MSMDTTLAAAEDDEPPPRSAAPAAGGEPPPPDVPDANGKPSGAAKAEGGAIPAPEPAPEADETALYRRAGEEIYIRTFGPNRPDWEPSAGALQQLRERLASSPIVVVSCRFEPEQIAFRALQPRSGNEGQDWMIDAAGSVANGELRPLLEHVRRVGRQARYRIAMDSSAGQVVTPGLLAMLADDARRTELANALAEQAATLLVIVKHVVKTSFRDLREEFSRGCEPGDGWIVELPWENELPRSWVGAPSVRSADRSGEGFSGKVRTTLSDPGKREREYHLFQALARFGREHVWNPMTMTAAELHECFDAAITTGLDESTESEAGRARKWTDDVEAVLRSPEGERTLDKRMLTIAACLPINARFGAFRSFGEVALHDEWLVEETLDGSEERHVEGQRRTVIRRRSPERIKASAAWSVRFDHLARAAGLEFRRDQDERVIQFPDPSRKSHVRRRLFDQYPSLVLDLALKLLKVDALFHIDPDVRDCAGLLLTTLDDFDSTLAEEVLRMALSRADRLAARGPASDTPISDLPKALFAAPRREHAICVLQLFRKVVQSGKWAGRKDVLRNMLIDPALWQRGRSAIDGVLIRTEVLLGLPLDGMEALARCIDTADTGIFPHLRDAMATWPRDNSGTKVDLLLAVAPWLQGIGDAKELRRSQLLAMILWTSTAVDDASAGAGLYRAEAPREGLGSAVFLEPTQTQALLPHLMGLPWNVPRPGGADADQLLVAMCVMMVAAPESSPVEPVLESHRQGLLAIAADVLIDPKGTGMDHRVVDPKTVQVGRILGQLREVAEAHSGGDPRRLEILLSRFLSDADNEFVAATQPLLKELERRLQPLKRMPGALLAHWCFEHTGIPSTPDEPDPRITAFLDAVATTLSAADQERLTQQWTWLADQFERIGRRVRSMPDTEIDKPGRHAVAATMESKAARLRQIRDGLAYRMDPQSEEHA